jgi:7-cyano-7-deazaguanine synthase
VLQRLREAFPAWGERLGEDHLLDLSVLGQVSDTALTSGKAIEYQANGLPNTFVPARNLLFFTLAAALAYRRGIGVLVGGMCETDYSGYPDCRNDTLQALQRALSLGLDQPLRIETPLMWVDKAGTWRLAQSLGGDALLAIVRDATHTCYLGDHHTRHAWGLGCGSCPACELRRQGYLAFSAAAAG